MLSYQHGYHAGNFADVVKHLTLTRIMNYMVEKDKPLFYMETHAGRGMYDLKDGQSSKTEEFREGISLLWEKRQKAPALLTPYLDVIKSLNPSDTLRYYPGSPYLAIAGLRSQDRLCFSELHPREFSYLEQLPDLGQNVSFNHSDGLKELSARLPPIERRGLIFMDPSYEIKDDYKSIPNTIKTALSRFSTGVYCLWYPLVDRRLHDQLIRGLRNIGSDNVLRIEFFLSAKAQAGMNGCGLWVINPPYMLAEEMKSILNFLRTLFNPGVSSFLIEK
ncbi:MAG: 23S rRNA (adenine(2030)-N(6))-methyltransferase RlmJ [Legionella sp.]|nr:23S rRNA (adenine(2030)-N(6))-methyltransferase RlmJ [Legionella sp.]